jgi:hypothetical protein
MMMEELTKPSTDQIEESEPGKTLIECYILTSINLICKMTVATVMFLHCVSLGCIFKATILFHG